MPLINPDEQTLSAWIQRSVAGNDTAHDLQHVKRVVHNARKIGEQEGADLSILIPAAWLHDCVVLPKNSPERSQASRHAAEMASGWLRTQNLPEHRIEAIAHCIEAHSYSAGITPQTPEARILQDADRLDALGAIGIARCFVTGAGFGAAFYHPEIPLPREALRSLDDKAYTLDHFFTKLYRLPGLMNTPAARQIAETRVAFMQSFVRQLLQEIQAD